MKPAKVIYVPLDNMGVDCGSYFRTEGGARLWAARQDKVWPGSAPHTVHMYISTPKPTKRAYDWRLVAKSGKVVGRFMTRETARWHADNWGGGIVVENAPAKKRSK